MYIFYDHHVNPHIDEEFDISGVQYKELITTCCRFCNTVSFRIEHGDTVFTKKLDKYRIIKPDSIEFAYQHFYQHNSTEHQNFVRYYRVCRELIELILSACNSIFSWIHAWGYENPEDPVFYREDGSVFFATCIHEGECILTPRPNEDIRHIISNDHWIALDEYH